MDCVREKDGIHDESLQHDDVDKQAQPVHLIHISLIRFCRDSALSHVADSRPEPFAR